MKYTNRLTGLALVSVASFMVQTAHADEPMTSATPTKEQWMRDCIRKHQSGDVNQSKDQLNRLCKEELKQQKTTGTPPPPAPPTDGPQTPQTPP